MTTTRDVFTLLNHQPDKKLQPVEPTKSLLITPMPCENTCAAIRNQTVSNLEAGNTAQIAYRYMQNNAGAYNTLIEILAFGALAGSTVYRLATNRQTNYFVDACGLIIDMLNVLPNINNTLRYRESRDACAEWLETRLSPEKMAQIKALRYDQNGIRALVNLMRDEHVDLSFIQKKAEIPDTATSCWNLDR